jgi:hypothetical protein
VNPAVGRSGVLRELAEISSKYAENGFHLVISASSAIMRSMDDVVRRAMESRYALGLDSGEAASSLGARIRANNSIEFPPGRGFLVRSGRHVLMQVSTPQEDPNTSMEDALDKWVQTLTARRMARAKWYAEIVPMPEAAAAAAPAGTPAAAGGARVASGPNDSNEPDLTPEEIQQAQAQAMRAAAEQEMAIKAIEEQAKQLAEAKPAAKAIDPELVRRAREAQMAKLAAQRAASEQNGGQAAPQPETKKE